MSIHLIDFSNIVKRLENTISLEMVEYATGIKHSRLLEIRDHNGNHPTAREMVGLYEIAQFPESSNVVAIPLSEQHSL